MATKERIRNIALKLMRTHSIDEISVQEICSKANVGIGTFYHYYPAKDDIIREVYYEMDAHFLKLAEEAEQTMIEPQEYILRHSICYARFITETSVDFVRKVYSTQSKEFLNRTRPVYTTLQSYLVAQQKARNVADELDIDAFCDYINIWLRGISFDWCVHDGDYDLVQRVIDYNSRALAGYRQMLGG